LIFFFEDSDTDLLVLFSFIADREVDVGVM
jgi:hypothetical protein